jgi:hypothetical protein
MQDKTERPPIVVNFVKRDNDGVAGPGPDIVRHELAVAEDEPAGYNPYDNPPPLVTRTPQDASLVRRPRTNGES